MLYKSLQLWCSRAGQQWFYRRTESGPGKLRIFYSNAASSSSTTLLSSWVGLNFFICFSVVMAAASHHKRQAMVVWWYKRMKIVDPLQGFLLLLTWGYAWLLWWYLACNYVCICVCKKTFSYHRKLKSSSSKITFMPNIRFSPDIMKHNI